MFINNVWFRQRFVETETSGDFSIQKVGYMFEMLMYLLVFHFFGGRIIDYCWLVFLDLDCFSRSYQNQIRWGWPLARVARNIQPEETHMSYSCLDGPKVNGERHPSFFVASGGLFSLCFLISPCFLTISHCLATWLSQAGTATPYWGFGTSFFPWN